MGLHPPDQSAASQGAEQRVKKTRFDGVAAMAMAGVALAARVAALGEGLALEMKHTSQGVLLSSSSRPHSHTRAGIAMASVLRTLATTYYEAYEGSGHLL